MLAVVTVNTDQDIVDPSDQLTSLREAIQMANDLEGADEIVFDFGHDRPTTIQLEHGTYELTDEVKIRGPGQEMLTVDARQSWRIPFPGFHFTATEGDFTVEGLTLNGAGVWSESQGMLTILDSVVTNHQFEWGRGSVIAALSGNVTVQSSTISGNRAAYDDWPSIPIPGIVWSGGDVTVSSSTISQNSTSGIVAGGNVTVSSSTISGNRGGSVCVFGPCGLRDDFVAGGISAGGDVAISSSTISENSLGGVRAFCDVVISSSTISGNAGVGVTGGQDGGNVTIQSSTIVGNLNHGFGRGIGVSVAYGDLVVENSIVAHNAGGDLENYPYDPTADIGRKLCLAENGPENCPEPSSEPTWAVRHSLIGHNRGTPLVEAPLGHPDSDGNLVGGSVGGAIDPRLGPLADNGGPTLTHALLPDSPAINMGDPSGIIGGVDPPRFDQRGEPYSRVVDGRLDMGAFERGIAGDANGDGKVDFVDFVMLAEHFGTGQGWAEGNFDGSEDGTQFADFLALANNFGFEEPAANGIAAAAHAPATTFSVVRSLDRNHGSGRSRPELIDDLLAGDLLDGIL